MRIRTLVVVAGTLAAAIALVLRARRKPTPWITDAILVGDEDVLEEEVFDEVTIVRVRDGGDLYGAHTIPSADRQHPDDDRAQETGETWLEALTEDATEGGPEAERSLDFTDVDDIDHPPSDTRDRPIADKGSAGNRGL
jgi:hypothetical protein